MTRDPLERLDSWPVPSAAAGWLRLEPAPGRSETRGPADRRFALASLTKPLVAYAILVAVEEGSLHLDAEDESGLGPSPAASNRQLLAHAGGLAPDAPTLVAEVGTRRIYSNSGFEELGRRLERATAMPMAVYLTEAVTQPLAMNDTVLDGSPAFGAQSTVYDLLRFVAELMAPTLIAAETLAEATSPQFPDLDGVLPGYGQQKPNPWGLGFEIRGTKSPHWTSPRNSASTFGHFGRSGTMFWIDPNAGLGCIALTDREFGPWASEAWPALSTDLLDSFGN